MPAIGTGWPCDRRGDGHPCRLPRRGAASARLAPWQEALCRDPDRLDDLLAAHGSPVNVLDPRPLGANAAELERAAASAGIELAVFFARKANKAIAFVDEANRLGLGVDVASERELVQVLDRGVPAERVIVTAAVKPRALLERCAAVGALVAIDNADELSLLAAIAAAARRRVPVALRLAPELAPTRFGMGLDELLALQDRWPDALAIAGVHFHLDGYAAADRAAALGQSLALVDALRERGHAPGFVDIGGGIPMRYLDDGEEWDGFWRAHRVGLLAGEPLTFSGHGLGLTAHEGRLIGAPAVYPYHQELVRGAWLADVLARPCAGAATAAGALRARGLQLRCEPGRSLLDGCGLTAARVEFRKPRADGTWLIGLAMNRTQCRSTSDDFLVDPLLVRPGAVTGAPVEGYLVGAYCIERELLTWRRLRFAHGVEVGDIVVFPNTAGYLMHILESASHQIPLARNVVLDGTGARLDAIELL